MSDAPQVDPSFHPPRPDERALAGRLRNGDGEAFDFVFHAWYIPLVRMADRMVRDRERAEEIVQDVMLELWRGRDRLSANGSVAAYLYQATRNRALNDLRHLRVQHRAPPADRDGELRPLADVRLLEEEIEVALQRAVADLPKRCREVFELSRVRGLTYAEIAQTLGVSVKAVEAHMGKALRTLRARLAPWLPNGKNGSDTSTR